MTVLSLVQGPGLGHDSALPIFICWCNKHFWTEMYQKPEFINDFDKNCSRPVVGLKVEIVESYKYLGTVFDSICRHGYHCFRRVNRGITYLGS